MPKSFSMLLGVNSAALSDRDAFDPIMDVDTRLFIDPHLLRHIEVDEFTSSYENFQAHFQKVAKLLSASDTIGDVFWRQADRLMQWPEVQGLCIGYASRGTSGSGIGPNLRRRLLVTAQSLIKKGCCDPELFELVGLLEDDFGPDRISDMTANVIRNDLGAFTRRIYRELLVEEGAQQVNVDSKTGLPINPYTDKPLLLVPATLLRDLPVALDWSSRDIVAQHNQELRARVNSIIGDSWKKATSTISKDRLKEVLLENPDLVADLIAVYIAKGAQYYDFKQDRAGEYVWFPVARKVAEEYPLRISLPTHPTVDEVEAMVIEIVNRFKSLIENNGLNRLLYDSDGSPKHESAAQLLFFGIADSYCAANNVMIARESNAGRGPVDFKFGSNMENSVLVELKKSTNTSGLKKGVERQLPEYMNAEGGRRAIYLVIDVGLTNAAIGNLNKISERVHGTAIKIMHVDGNPKDSASKMR